MVYSHGSGECIDVPNLTLKSASLKMKPRELFPVQATAAHQFKGGDKSINPNLMGEFSGRQ